MDVVIPAFNAERTIAATLQSVLRQTYPIETIHVVDDGSSDRTAAIVREHCGDDRRLLLHRQANSGPAAARNRAIGASRAALIAPVDADDVWDRNYLERMVEGLLTHPEAAFVYCHHRLGSPDLEETLPAKQFLLRGSAWLPMLLVNFVGNGSCVVFRRDALVEVGGYDCPLPGYRGAEDYALQLRLLERWQVACQPEILMTYRKRSDSLSSDSRLARDARIAAVRRSLASGPCLAPRRRRAIMRWVEADAWRVDAVGRLRQRRWAAAMASATRSLAIDPAGTLGDFARRLANATRRLGGGVAPRSHLPDGLLLKRIELLSSDDVPGGNARGTFGATPAGMR